MIRNAVLGDLDALVVLGRQMHSESLEEFPPIEPDRFQKHLEMTIDNPEFMFCAVAEMDGIIGMVTAVAGDYSFSTEKRTSCDLLFVTPDRRGFHAAKGLVDAFKDWSDGIGAKVNFMGVSTGVHPERTGRLFERLGFEFLGKTYRRVAV